MVTRTESFARLLTLASLALAPALGACGGDDDDTTPTPGTDPTPTAVPDVPTPTPDTVTPTPDLATPTPSIFPLEISEYVTLTYGVVWEFSEPLLGYQYLSWGGDVTFSEDGSTIEGHNQWSFWLVDADPSAVPASCVMPETFSGTRAAKVDSKAKGCSVTYNIAFQPLEETTTCPSDLVEEWNGPNPYNEWSDSWSLWDVATKGYPTAFAEDAETFDSLGTRFVIFTNWITGNPSPDELVMPPCTDTLTSNCYPVD